MTKQEAIKEINDRIIYHRMKRDVAKSSYAYHLHNGEVCGLLQALWLVENIEEPGLPDSIKEALNSGDGVYRP